MCDTGNILSILRFTIPLGDRKQPNNNIWIFNENVHTDNSGLLIPVRERCFVISKDGKLPELINVTGGIKNIWGRVPFVGKLNSTIHWIAIFFFKIFELVQYSRKLGSKFSMFSYSHSICCKLNIIKPLSFMTFYSS